MAIEIADITTLLDELDITAGLSEYTFSTATFAAEGMTLAIVAGEHASNTSGALGLGTPTTTGVDWGSPIASIASANNVAMRVYQGTVNTPGTVATVVNFPDTQDQCSLLIINVENADVVTNIKTISQGLGGTFSVTLDTAASASSAVFMFSATERSVTYTKGATQTAISSDLTDVFLLGQYNLDADIAPDCTVAPDAGSVSIGFEVTAIAETDTLMTLLLEEANPTVSVADGSLIVGDRYEIEVVGTSDFTIVGASANTVGVRFRATGTDGGGNGTALEVDPVICESTDFAKGVTAYVLRGGTVSEQATEIRSGTTESSSEITLYCTYPNGDPVLGDSDAVVFFYDNTIGDIKSVTGSIPLATGSYTGDTCS